MFLIALLFCAALFCGAFGVLQVKDARAESACAHEYVNACDPDCNLCGEERTTFHDFTVESYDSTHHWVECSVCGTKDEGAQCPACGLYHHESSVKAHVYSANCDSRCDDCGYTRNATGIHKYAYLITPDGHQTACSKCGDKATPVSAHGYKDACDSSCEVCNYKREIAHDYTVEKFDGTNHWIQCSVCSSTKPDSTAEHAFDNACDTVCNGCDFEREITHDYSVADKDETHHFNKCSVCGEVDESTKAEHTFDNACDTVCNGCDFERETTHDYSVADKDETHHFNKCSVCGEVNEDSKAEHAFDNACDTVCNGCDFERETTHDYSVCESNDTEHWLVCSVCGEKDGESVSAHSYDGDEDAICNQIGCGHERALQQPTAPANEGIFVQVYEFFKRIVLAVFAFLKGLFS